MSYRLLITHEIQNSNYIYVGYDSEKAMAPYSSTLTWKNPWMEEPGRLQSMGSGRVGHDWATSLSLFTFMHWKRKWQPTPVFLPGESQGRGSLVGCRLWGSHRVRHGWSDLAAAGAADSSWVGSFWKARMFLLLFCGCSCIWVLRAWNILSVR